VKEISERKLQVIQKAEQLFSEKGYLATSVRDLAQALNIEAASLYSHVKSKEDLLWAIADRSAAEFFQNVEPIAKQNLQTTQKLTRMIIAHVEVIANNLEASAVFFREWRHLSDPRLSEYAEKRTLYEQIFRNVVREGIEDGIFKTYDDGFSTRTILSAINWTHTWYRPDGELTAVQIGENLANFLLNGLVRSI
jgi:AcrR family transcriptional regulator